MSIYSTLADWVITVHAPQGKVKKLIFFQGVPSHIQDDWDWLLAPIPDEPDENGYIRMREVVVVDETTEKVGQRYVDPIMRMCEHDYRQRTATDAGRSRLRMQIRRKLERRLGQKVVV